MQKLYYFKKKSFCKKEIKSAKVLKRDKYSGWGNVHFVSKKILQRRRKFSPPLEIAKFNGIFGQPWNLVNSS